MCFSERNFIILNSKIFSFLILARIFVITFYGNSFIFNICIISMDAQREGGRFFCCFIAQTLYCFIIQQQQQQQQLLLSFVRLSVFFFKKRKKERKKECFACCVHSPCTPCIQYIQHTYTHRGGLFFCFKENKKEGKGKKLDFSGFVDPASEQ